MPINSNHREQRSFPSFVSQNFLALRTSPDWFGLRMDNCHFGETSNGGLFTAID
jgi:hypothetical protein